MKYTRLFLFLIVPIVLATRVTSATAAPSVAEGSGLENAAADSEVQEPRAYPVVVRVARYALESRTSREIDRSFAIDRSVLGAHVVGGGRALGRVTATTVGEQGEASFLLSFVGRAHSATTGQRGPAIVHSHTDTEFLCTRQVMLDPHRGFVAAPAQIAAGTRLTNDRVDSTHGGVRGRVVQRLAERRAAEMHAAAQQIAAHESERELLEKFERALDEQLAKVNKRLILDQYLNRLFGEGTPLHVAAYAQPDGIYFGIGTTPSRAPLVLPDRSNRPAQRVELWVQPSLFGPEAQALWETAERSREISLSNPARPIVLDMFSISADDPSQPVGVIVEDGWIVIAIE